MSKHTPGPWEVIPQHGGGPMIAHRYETGQQMNPTGLRLVCHMLARRDSLPTDNANARLIAAAPDLLEALKQAEEWLSGWASAEPYIDIIRAAIAKAEGSSLADGSGS